MLRMTFGLLASVAVVVFSLTVVQAQGDASKHDLRGRPALEINANIRVHKVMGEIGTFMVGEFAPGFKSAPHHHTTKSMSASLACTTS